MFCIECNPEKNTPLWAGWNSKFYSAEEPLQKIWYMKQINASATANSVVKETMQRALLVAEECQRKSIAVSYDLAIAKIAMQIQETERPAFDKLFICLGVFHIEMAFFSALGKVIADSGGIHVLNECEVLAPGSVNSFTKGKNYKRCKRVHMLLAVSMQCVHFRSFLEN